MFNFQQKAPDKRYGRVKRGWHHARIYRAELRNARSADRLGRKYIRVDFEVIRDRVYRDVLVSGFFRFDNKKPDRRFLDLGYAAGLQQDYGDNIGAVLRDLWGREVLVFVVHRYRNQQRRDYVQEFRPLPTEAQGNGNESSAPRTAGEASETKDEDGGPPL